MMRKRRAESSSLQESPPPPRRMKKVLCGAEPGLFSTSVGEHRRKRPRCCEDQDLQESIEEPGGERRTRTHGGEEKEEEEEEVREEEPADGKILKTTEKMDKCEKATLPDGGEDELCEFNSFQFWRNPLPALDLSLLDAPSIAELSQDSSLKDSSEEMET